MTDKAIKYYNIASVNKFTKGRKTTQLVGAILYLSCRTIGTRHLLIDFSEVLQINLFVIGSVYLKLLNLMRKVVPISVKIIDPSLFIHRLCDKLEFGNQSPQVGNTALK